MSHADELRVDLAWCAADLDFAFDDLDEDANEDGPVEDLAQRVFGLVVGLPGLADQTKDSVEDFGDVVDPSDGLVLPAFPRSAGRSASSSPTVTSGGRDRCRMASSLRSPYRRQLARSTALPTTSGDCFATGASTPF